MHIHQAPLHELPRKSDRTSHRGPQLAFDRTLQAFVPDWFREHRITVNPASEQTLTAGRVVRFIGRAYRSIKDSGHIEYCNLGIGVEVGLSIRTHRKTIPSTHCTTL